MNEKNNPLPSNIDIINVLKNSNLTPSQKVSVITEINNKNQPSKNLSHVPCKFFRQGACQAGNSCPFSHAIDLSVEPQPCKYFQKGNCKFGAKCALAHVMPDGKKVNTKVLQSSFHATQLNPSSGLVQKKLSIGNNDSSPSDIINTVEPININNYHRTNQQTQHLYMNSNNNNNNNINGNSQQQILNYNNNNHNINNFNTNSSFTNSTIQYPNNIYPYTNNKQFSANQNYNYNYNSGPFDVSPSSSVQTSSTAPSTFPNSAMANSYNNTSIWSNINPSTSVNSSGINGTTLNGNMNMNAIRSISFSNGNSNSTFTNQPFNMNRAPSNSNSSYNQSFNQSSSTSSRMIFSPISSSNPQTYSAIVDSAILDSEEEEEDDDVVDATNINGEKTRSLNKDALFDVSEGLNFVPSSLNDLLTPQELKRRNSRSSSSFSSYQHNPSFSLSTIKGVYNLVEEETPFVMD